MLSQAVAATVKLLLFRGGPQDFPFSAGRALTAGCIAFAIAALALPRLAVTNVLAGVAFGAAVVLSVFVFVRLMLRLKRLENRFQQTFNAMLCAQGALVLLTVPAWVAVLPTLTAMQQKLLADPTIADSPQRIAALQAEMQAAMPPSATFMIFVVFLWQLMMAARVLGKATDSSTVGAAGLALLCLFNLFAFMLFVEPLLLMLQG